MKFLGWAFSACVVAFSAAILIFSEPKAHGTPPAKPQRVAAERSPTCDLSPIDRERVLLAGYGEYMRRPGAPSVTWPEYREFAERRWHCYARR